MRSSRKSSCPSESGECASGRSGMIPYFDRAGLYQEAGVDYPDNLERFVFFCRAIIETMVYLQRERKWATDLLHLHDWQTALCAVYLKTTEAGRAELSAAKTVLTLHNIGYQGLFPGSEFAKDRIGLFLVYARWAGVLRIRESAQRWNDFQRLSHDGEPHLCEGNSRSSGRDGIGWSITQPASAIQRHLERHRRRNFGTPRRILICRPHIRRTIERTRPSASRPCVVSSSCQIRTVRSCPS